MRLRNNVHKVEVQNYFVFVLTVNNGKIPIELVSGQLGITNCYDMRQVQSKCTFTSFLILEGVPDGNVLYALCLLIFKYFKDSILFFFNKSRLSLEILQLNTSHVLNESAFFYFMTFWSS